CGGTLSLSLQLQDGVSDLGVLHIPLTLGGLSNGQFTASYGSGDLAIPILNLRAFEVPITVPDDGIVQDVNVRLRLDHGFDSDLTIPLVHPDGPPIRLADRRGSNQANFGTGANDCSGSPTVFDDSAATAIAAGFPPFQGSYRPDSPLSGLNGKPSAGVWK